MRIRTKLIASYLAIILLFTLLGILGQQKLHSTGEHFDLLFDHAFQELSALQSIEAEVFKMQAEILSAASHLMEENGHSSEELEEEEAEFYEARESLEIALANLEGVQPGADPLALKLMENADVYLAVGKAMFALAGDSYDLEKAETILEKLEVVEEDFVAISKQALEEKQAAYQQEGEQIKSSIAKHRQTSIAMWAIIVGLTLVLGWLFSAHIFRPLEYLSKAFKQLTSGDFNVNSSIQRKDEIGELAHDFDQMVEELGQAKLVRQQQAELERLNEALMQKNDALDQFVYRVSHDLKAPTVNILSLLKIVKGRLANNEDTMLQKSLGFINDSAARLQRTTFDLLEVSRLEKGMNEASVWNDLQSNFETAMSALTEQIVATNAQFNTNFKNCPQVYLSEVNLQSILSNLLTNAIKYRQPEKQPVIELRSELKGKWAIISIRDNGLGIDLERHKDKVFGMFNRFHNHVEGSGVGLYIVKKIVDNAGGKLELTSKPGEGTTFLLKFPNEPSVIKGAAIRSAIPIVQG